MYVAYEVEIIGTVRPILNMFPYSGQGIILGGVKQIDS